MVADRVFLFSLGRAAIIGSLCLAILREYMSVGHSPYLQKVLKADLVSLDYGLSKNT